MTEFERYVADLLAQAIACPRCQIPWYFEDGRCVACGMTRDEQGPAPRRLIRGIEHTFGLEPD